MKTTSLVLVLIAAAMLSGCNRNLFSNSGADVSGYGQVRFIDLEGGFYGIIAENGEKYEPVNLPYAFQQKMLEVKFNAKLRPDVVSVRMWGRPVEIIDIKKAK